MWWIIWLVVAIVAAIGEMGMTGFFLAPFAVAAVVTAVIAAVFPAAVAVQVVAFVALSVLGLAVLRPVVVRAMGWSGATQISGPVPQTYLLNKRATVTRTVDANGGQIRIGDGEFWSARAFDPGDTMLPGTVVEIVVVDGLTALVAPVSQPVLESQEAATSEKGM